MKVVIDNKISDLVKRLEKKVDEVTKQTLNSYVDYASNLAQRGFDRFAFEASTDYPSVLVNSTPLRKDDDIYSRTIECRGDQVLFIEFGVGLMKYTDIETRLYEGILKDEHGMPISSRPSSIDEIGTYGKGYGSQDFWVRPSVDGIPRNADEMPVAIRGNPTQSRTDVVWTKGHRPARALYRAVGMAMRRLLGGKLK